MKLIDAEQVSITFNNDELSVIEKSFNPLRDIGYTFFKANKIYKTSDDKWLLPIELIGEGNHCADRIILVFHRSSSGLIYDGNINGYNLAVFLIMKKTLQSTNIDNQIITDLILPYKTYSNILPNSYCYHTKSGYVYLKANIGESNVVLESQLNVNGNFIWDRVLDLENDSFTGELVAI
jgi:hypothetical protein